MELINNKSNMKQELFKLKKEICNNCKADASKMIILLNKEINSNHEKTKSDWESGKFVVRSFIKENSEMNCEINNLEELDNINNNCKNCAKIKNKRACIALKIRDIDTF